MVKVVLKVMASCYGIFGVINLSTFLYFFVYGSPLKSLPWGFTIEALGTPLFISIFSFLIMYSFWKLKKWGRYVAIVFNLIGLLGFGWGFRFNPPITALTVLYFLFFILLPGSIILFCLHPKVKQLMQN